MKGKFDPTLMHSDVGKLVMAIEEALRSVGGQLTDIIEFTESPTGHIGDYQIRLACRFGRDISTPAN